MNEEQLGFDPTIITLNGERYIEIERNGRIKPHREGDAQTPLVIKDFWQYTEREEEGGLLREATGRGVSNVARYYYHETIQVRSTAGLKRSSSQTGASLPPSKRSCSTSPTKAASTPLPNRVHRRVVLRDYGKPIYRASSRAALLRALERCIEGHESLRKAGLLHRDISINNLIINEDNNNPSWPFFLIHLNLAIKEQQEGASGAKGKTGTRAFMVIGALLGEQHSFMHDLESFFWVLFWICIHYNGPGKDVGPTEFESWNYESDNKLVRSKKGVIDDEEDFLEMANENFTQYYQPLIPWANKLRRKVFPNGERWKRANPELYYSMKEILRETQKDSKFRITIFNPTTKRDPDSHDHSVISALSCRPPWTGHQPPLGSASSGRPDVSRSVLRVVLQAGLLYAIPQADGHAWFLVGAVLDDGLTQRALKEATRHCMGTQLPQPKHRHPFVDTGTAQCSSHAVPNHKNNPIHALHLRTGQQPTPVDKARRKGNSQHSAQISELRFLRLTTTLLLANNLSSRPLTLKNPDSMSQDRQTVISRDDKRRIITKAIKPFTNLDYRGVDMAKKWPRQRILNEAAALKLIRDSTTIPVPAVIAVGEGPDGFFVTTGLIAGIPLADIGDKCELPALPGHEKTKCAACQATATANAKTFVEKTVLPQLRRLTSYTTGLNGFVNPPPWVTEVDRREFWDTKTSAVPEFVFCHGDLGPYNIMIDQFTLKVTGLIDFENAGYFPSEFLEQRAIDVKGYYKMYKTMYENPAELSRLIKALES
ncbi:hypothetical protein MKZ38_000561 [Zalerion maritima]|uniref:non-specific serine/threonine protein kinase n=1 Tax=Zalerion maritima TaxID=339359 RepID=A0AAD5WLN4_9PEZI|nr:hypothetical protein MKZ38_000561 [Zalerion maritima]